MTQINAGDLIKGLGTLADDVAATPVLSVATDSRQVGFGGVFVAIKGEQADGHDFAEDAILSGAVLVVVERKINGIPSEKQLIVKNCLDAMIIMGKNYREQFDLKIVGVTGSVGKTTTKEFIYHVLSAFGKTLKTQGNQNNEIGVPSTLFEIDDSYRYGVVEMGMSALRDIQKLSGAATPCIGVITNIGVAHIEHLKTRENILQAKLEICSGITPGGILVLNGDDDMLVKAPIDKKIKKVFFAVDNNSADVFASDIEFLENTTRFTINDQYGQKLDAVIPTLGKHNVYNALCAYTVATCMGHSAKTAAGALGAYEGYGMRQKFVNLPNSIVIEDCYNANPASMEAAIKTLAAVQNVKKRIAVIGDMLELGEMAPDAHRRVGELIAEYKIDAVVAYGEFAKFVVEGTGDKVEQSVYTDDKFTAIDGILDFSEPDSVLLFKASRGVKLEDLLELYYKQRG